MPLRTVREENNLNYEIASVVSLHRNDARRCVSANPQRG